MILRVPENRLDKARVVSSAVQLFTTSISRRSKTARSAAALGAGIAFATMLGSTPIRPGPRSLSQKITAQILSRIVDLEAARCCRRECSIVLTAAAELSRKYLPITLRAAASPTCDQFDQNRECPGADCPSFPDVQER